MRALQYVLIFVFGALLSSTVSSQELDNQIRKYQSGTVDEKISLIMNFYNLLPSIKKDSVLYFIEDLQNAGIENDRDDAIAMSNYIFGHYLNDNSLFSESLRTLEDAEEYYQFKENDSMLAVVSNAIGNNYFLQSERKKAEEYYLSSIEQGRRSKITKFEALSFANLARIYISQEKYEEAKKLLDEYVELNEDESNIRNLGTAYGLYGQLYLNQQDFNEAIKQLEQSMEYNLATGNNELIGNGYTNLAIAAYYKNDLDRAKNYFNLALAYREKSGTAYHIAESHFNIGDFFFGTNQLDSAEYAYKRSLKVARQSDNLVGVKDALMQLSVLYDSLSLYDKESEMLREYIDVTEDLNNEKISRELASLRLNFEQNLEKQEYLTAQREDELRSQIRDVSTVWDYWIWIVLVCVLTIAGFVLVSYGKTKRLKND